MPYRNLGGTGLMVRTPPSSCKEKGLCTLAHRAHPPSYTRKRRTHPLTPLLRRHACFPCQVSALSFGTMTLNDNPGGEIEGKITRGEEAYELLEAAYKGGVNFFGARFFLEPPALLLSLFGPA